MRSHPHEAVLAITLTGEIDLDSSTGLRAELVALCSAVQGRQLDLDLSGVTFMDATGLRLLLDASRVLEHRDRRLHLTDVPAPVRRMIDAAGLSETLTSSPPDDDDGSCLAPLLPFVRGRRTRANTLQLPYRNGESHHDRSTR